MCAHVYTLGTGVLGSTGFATHMCVHASTHTKAEGAHESMAVDGGRKLMNHKFHHGQCCEYGQSLNRAVTTVVATLWSQSAS